MVEGIPHFIEYMSVRMARVCDLRRAYMRARWSRQQFPRYRGNNHAFACSFSALKMGFIDTSRRSMAAYGNGRAVARKDCTPACLLRACHDCRYPFHTIPVDTFRTTRGCHEDGCTLKLI